MQLMHQQRIVPVAEPLWFEAEPTLLGAPFFVMQRIYGRVAVSMPPYVESGWVVEATPEQRHKMSCNGVRKLAAIQRLPQASAAFLKGPAGAESGLTQEWDKFKRFAAWVSQDRRWPPLEKAMAHLERTWPKNQPAGIVWGDARIGNMMFDDNFEVVAVTDWEQPSLGGALHDLAWWLEMAGMREWTANGGTTLPGFLTRDEVIRIWQQETGLPVDDLDWYIDFTRFKVACLGIRTAALRGWPTPKEDEMLRRMNLS
jgi:aminoglycoside phosphotransferase (APT) family kinase protein